MGCCASSRYKWFKKPFAHVQKERDVSSEELEKYLSSIIEQESTIYNKKLPHVSSSLNKLLLRKMPTRKYSISKRERKKEEHYRNKKQCIISQLFKIIRYNTLKLKTV